MSWNWCCHVYWKSSSIFFRQHITSCYLVWDHIPFKRWQAARDMRTSTKSSYYETCAEVWAWLCSTHTLKWGENPKSVWNLGWCVLTLPFWFSNIFPSLKLVMSCNRCPNDSDADRCLPLLCKSFFSHMLKHAQTIMRPSKNGASHPCHMTGHRLVGGGRMQ